MRPSRSAGVSVSTAMPVLDRRRRAADGADRLRTRLPAVSAQVRRLERQLRALRGRTTYATVDLTVTAPRRSTAAPGDDGRWTPADAWRDARRGLELAAGVLVMVLAFGLPLALVAALAAGAVGATRRRRRDAALDAA